MHAFWFAFVLWSVLFLLMSFLRNSATLDSHFLFFFKKFQTLAGFGEFLNTGLDCMVTIVINLLLLYYY